MPAAKTGDSAVPQTQNSTITPPIYKERCLKGLKRAQKLLADILAVSGSRTLENTLLPYNELLMYTEQSAGDAGLTSAVHPDEAIREAARVCERDIDAFSSALGRNRELFDAFHAIDTSNFDAETQRFVERTLRAFRRAGVDRDDDTRDRLKAIDEELTKLGQLFQKNIVDDVRSVDVPNREALAGLPEDFISAHAPAPQTSTVNPAGQPNEQTAEATDRDRAPQKPGSIRLTTDTPDYMPVMSYAESNDLRRELYIAFKSRGGTHNEDVLRQILALRMEKAQLLGYANWAEYAIEDKMMKRADAADAFIKRVANIASTRAEREYNQLLERKRRDEPQATAVEDYEKSFFENKVKAELYAFDPQSVRPYFPYRQVEQGLLDITAGIYGIEYRTVSGADADVWHSDVNVYDVIRDGASVGRIYLDMHPREGKYKHAAQFPYRSGVHGKQQPQGVLVCNFPNPNDGPALLEHGEVVTMFHEFGHLMHHILGGQKRWIVQSGVATEWDFVEAPSQMFEEWAWSHETLRTFAKHYQTGEEIPESLVADMRHADKFGIGLATVQQMFYASVSLSFHTTAPKELDMQGMVKELQSTFTPFRFVDGTCFHANFGHLNGYSALYYTYMWSLVIAKDLLTPFHEHGLMNTDWTQRYCDSILAPGGSKDAADLVQDFLGRPYNFDAFEAYLSE